MAGHSTTIEKKPNGKYAVFLHIEGVAEPVDLGKEFKSEDHADNWLAVSESRTTIDMFLRKHGQK